MLLLVLENIYSNSHTCILQFVTYIILLINLLMFIRHMLLVFGRSLLFNICVYVNQHLENQGVQKDLPICNLSFILIGDVD